VIAKTKVRFLTGNAYPKNCHGLDGAISSADGFTRDGSDVHSRSATRRSDRLVGCFSSTLDIGVMPQKSNAKRASVETSVFYS